MRKVLSCRISKKVIELKRIITSMPMLFHLLLKQTLLRPYHLCFSASTIAPPNESGEAPTMER